MLTLGIETATDICSVALLDGSTALLEASIHVPRSHGRRLAALIREAFDHVGREPGSLALVAVSVGPGSYTGLRIGVSTAKGLALATGARLVAVPTLDALAEAAPAPAHPLVLVLPSRRGEVYAAAVTASGVPLRPATALALPEADAWLPDGPLAVAGPGADRLVEAAPERLWHRLDTVPSGTAVARLGQRLVVARGAGDPAAVEPLYLKSFQPSQPRAIFEE